jgi:hypothetical protein
VEEIKGPHKRIQGYSTGRRKTVKQSGRKREFEDRKMNLRLGNNQAQSRALLLSLPGLLGIGISLGLALGFHGTRISETQGR